MDNGTLVFIFLVVSALLSAAVGLWAVFDNNDAFEFAMGLFFAFVGIGGFIALMLLLTGVWKI